MDVSAEPKTSYAGVLVMAAALLLFVTACGVPPDVLDASGGSPTTASGVSSSTSSRPPTTTTTTTTVPISQAETGSEGLGEVTEDVRVYESGLDLASVLVAIEPGCADATIEEVTDSDPVWVLDAIELLGWVEIVYCPSSGGISSVLILESTESRVRTSVFFVWAGCGTLGYESAGGYERAGYVYGPNWLVELPGDWEDSLSDRVVTLAGGTLHSVACDEFSGRLIEVVGEYALPPPETPQCWSESEACLSSWESWAAASRASQFDILRLPQDVLRLLLGET